jgi:hypothetical protein
VAKTGSQPFPLPAAGCLIIKQTATISLVLRPVAQGAPEISAKKNANQIEQSNNLTGVYEKNLARALWNKCESRM